MRRAVVLFLLAASVLSTAASAEPLTFTFHDFDDRQAGVQTYFERGLFLGGVIPGLIMGLAQRAGSSTR